MALTFDDGPSPRTLDLGRYLFSENISATFFQCGANILRHPGVGRVLLSMGHQLGNHTFTHLRLAPRLGWQPNIVTRKRIDQELTATQATIQQDAGILPTWFRAPYGMRWFGLAGVLQRLQLTGVMWTVIAHDWEWGAERVVAHVLRFIRPGGIICMHDGRDTRPDPDISVTLKAVRSLVPELKRRGYQFETISNILKA